MLLTIFLAIVFCAAMALMLLSAVAFIQDNRFFSSAPKEARDVIKQKDIELFYGARKIGWTLFILSVLMILGVGVISIWDGIRSGFTFVQFFLRFVLIFTIYKLCDMILIDNFLLLKFHFFQYYYCACIRPHSHWNVHFRQQGFSISQRPGIAARLIDLQAAIRHDQQFVIRIDFRTDVRVFGEGKGRNTVLPIADGL